MKGHIRPRGKGTWAVVVDAGRKPDGTRNQQWHTVHGSKKDAEREMARLIHEIETGAFVEPSRMHLRDYLEQWLADYAKTNVGAKTYQEYSKKIRSNIIPHLGNLKLPDLRPLHIQGLYTTLLEHGSVSGGPLAPQTVLHAHRILHKALEQAVKWELLARNPADAVEPPRPLRQEMKVLSPEQVHALVAFAKGTPFQIPVLLAVGTGMRRGEILGLKWGDIELGEGLLSVRRSLEETSAGLSFKEPKTQKSRRVVVIPAGTLASLTAHKGDQAAQRLLMGEAYQNQDLVCAREDGSPIPPNYISSVFPHLLAQAGLPRVRFHDLRHTHATMLLQQGIHPKVVSERLGHSTVGITLDIYSHVLPSMQEEAARRIDIVLQAAGTPIR